MSTDTNTETHRLWLVDRSRYEEGLGFCAMSRALKYHSGPTGYGLVRKAQSMPLATGSYVHEGLAEILRWVKDAQAKNGQIDLVPDEVIRPAVARAVAAYKAVIEKRGIRNLDAGERVEEIANEQASLIEGLIFGWCVTLLPWLLANFKVIIVEEETVCVIGCTCGLGDMVGSQQDHEARGCNGIGVMNRNDVITERWDGGGLGYQEFKTVGQAGDWWLGQWETKIQFALGIIGAEQKLERRIGEMWVHGLIKGRREGSYNYETGQKDGAPLQQSVFCYGYRNPGIPPQIAPEWKPKYEYIDADGKKRRVGKGFKKAPIWNPDYEIAPAAAGQGMSPAEYWLRQLPLEVVKEQFVLVGPLNRQDLLLSELLEEVIAHENRWKELLWKLHEVRAELAAEGVAAEDIEAHPTYQAWLRFYISRSWACRRMGQKYECEFVPYCFKHEGWDRIWDSEHFIARRPHHQPELDQAIARGLLPPDEGLAEEREE